MTDVEAPELKLALLGSGLPVLPRLRIAARYLSASDDRSGGGWFDAVAVPDSTVGLSVGLTPGSGLGAIATSSQLRAALNERLGTGADLVAVHSVADDLASRVAGLAGSSMALALLNPEDGTVRYLTRGNPAPVILRAGVNPEFLSTHRSPPLGIGVVPEIGAARLQPGDVVLLCNIGVTDRPGRTVSEGVAEFGLAAAVGSSGAASWASGYAERACRLADELVSGAGYAQDATILAAELLGAPVSPLLLDFPADIGSLHPARTQFAEWLTAAGAPSPHLENLELAIGEIITNAIVHAYPADLPGRIELRADLGPDGTVECQVTDYGTWKTPDLGADGGNGLMVASSMADRVRVRHPQRRGADGTVVTLQHKLSRPATFGSVAGATSIGRRQGLEVSVTGGPDVTGVAAKVSGPVDHKTADRLISRLLTASRGGTLPLVVDLSRVTYLDSAGVWALYQLTDQLAAQGQRLILVAPRWGRAHPMLELAGLPHQAGVEPAAHNLRSTDE